MRRKESRMINSRLKWSKKSKEEWLRNRKFKARKIRAKAPVLLLTITAAMNNHCLLRNPKSLHARQTQQ